MIFSKPIDEIIRERISVRTYSGQTVKKDFKNDIEAFITNLDNPFSKRVSFKLTETTTAANGAKLGTYGVIKGAADFIGATVVDDDAGLEALGYGFEKLILYITSLGLGTCWLGGTFKRGQFAEAMSVNPEEIFPVISPFGFANEKRSASDRLVRYLAKGDSRKSWSQLFYNGSFFSPLTAADAGAYQLALEMVRLGPSASNKQPWRIVKDGCNYHFYECSSPGYSSSFGYDIQRIDIGIAVCHFHLTTIEKGLDGGFVRLDESIADVPKGMRYFISWVSN